MLLEQTKEKLSGMKLRGMLTALEEWLGRGGEGLDPCELLGVLVDSEWTARENRRLSQRRRQARFPMAATVEAIDYQHPRGLSKAKLLELVSCQWVAAHQNLILTGPTGTGKTYLPCALGEKACREGYRVYYTRAPRLFRDLYQAKVDGTYPRMLQRLAKVQLLIIDDLGAPLDDNERRDLREVLEDRYSVSSTVITSQLDPKHWHSFIGDETIADAICDRVIHNAHRLKLSGESMRKKRGMNTAEGNAAGEEVRQ
jgi:DNA replication protein DnaC